MFNLKLQNLEYTKLGSRDRTRTAGWANNLVEPRLPVYSRGDCVRENQWEKLLGDVQMHVKTSSGAD